MTVFEMMAREREKQAVGVRVKQVTGCYLSVIRAVQVFLCNPTQLLICPDCLVGHHTCPQIHLNNLTADVRVNKG